MALVAIESHCLEGKCTLDFFYYQACYGCTKLTVS